ncbi:glutamyl aminopeptidase-like [Drosophila santomea]|uniref:glutamyl aminopeptidase-like n=1 Tax=Drosophila santomea TaxID=129105 RepID=UPI001CCF964C|nr:glutamyl aminopeptidase-like [Drosophila santomea]
MTLSAEPTAAEPKRRNRPSHRRHLRLAAIMERLATIPDEAKLLHDAWNLAYAGELNFATALNVTLFLKYERNLIVWNPVFTFLDQVGKRLEKSSISRKFEFYIIELLVPLYDYLETANVNDDINITEIRKLTTAFLCKAGYFPCFKAARRAFNLWVNSSYPNFENLDHNEFMCPMFKWGSMKEWMFGLDRVREFPKSRLQSDRTFLLKMLAGCPAQQDKIIFLLELAILKNVSIFSDNDKILIISMVSSRSMGYTTLFDFLSNNWDSIYQKNHKEMAAVDMLLPLENSLSTESSIGHIHNFLTALQMMKNCGLNSATRGTSSFPSAGPTTRASGQCNWKKILVLDQHQII